MPDVRWYVPTTTQASSSAVVKTSEAVAAESMARVPFRPLLLSRRLLSHEPSPKGQREREASLLEGTGKRVAKVRGHGGDACSPRRIPCAGQELGDVRDMRPMGRGSRGSRGASSPGQRSPEVLPPTRLVDLDRDAVPDLGAVTQWSDPAGVKPLPRRSRPPARPEQERGPEDPSVGAAPAGSRRRGSASPPPTQPAHLGLAPAPSSDAAARWEAPEDGQNSQTICSSSVFCEFIFKC